MSEAPSVHRQLFAVPYSCEQRSYNLIELPNGIRGFVIADPSEDLASCCLTVATGHHANPDDVPGLAHLCEHMVSLSSKDFPKIDAYRNAVHYAGGTRNALTTNETTSFYFNIPITASSKNQSDFENILDIFTSNFKNPNFESSYSNREIYAVDNEHTLNKTKRHRLAFQGYKLLANSKHPFSRFSTGNFESLTSSTQNGNTHSQLSTFFASEYTPDRMAFVLRGPQSLNYLQKLAHSKFGKIGESKFSHSHMPNATSLLNANVCEQVWSKRYDCNVYNKINLQRAVLINKDLDPLIRIAFPVCFKNLKMLTKKQIMFYINFWCETFGSEAEGTIASELSRRELIISITTKTSSITYDTVLLEIELMLTPTGTSYISQVIDVVFNYISLFTNNSPKFTKHLAKSMSQFNGISIYNFLNAGVESNSAWEERSISKNMLLDISSFGAFFVQGLHIYDRDTKGFCGGYSENNNAKEWWIKEAEAFQLFAKAVLYLGNSLVSFVGNVAQVNLDWIKQLPDNYHTETDFEFDFKIGMLNPDVVSFDRKTYNLGIAPPNMFADDTISNQTALLHNVLRTVQSSANAALGYSVKNITFLEKPILFHHDQGCQLWIKKEVDPSFKNKVLVTLELINTTIGAKPSLVIALEILVQLVKFRVNEYLYPAFTMNYCYDLFPSFKGDSGLLLHVSGPKNKFDEVLKVLINELKLISDSVATCVPMKEFEKARNAVLLKYKNAESMSSMETASLGLMASIEENTWMLDQRVESCEKMTIETLSSVLPRIFSSCYLTAFVQGEIDGHLLKDTILPIVTKLVQKFEGEEYQFPSSVMLPQGSNYFVHSFTKDHTNCVNIFFQTSLRDDIVKRSLTKFITFMMSASLVGKIRTEYQLGYIALAGLKSMRKTLGIQILVVSGSHSAETLDSKVDSLIMEWFNQTVKKLKTLQLNDLIDKFVTSEKASNRSLATTSGQHSLFFGMLGSSGGDKKIIKQHNSYWEQIENKSYAFSNNEQGEDSIDLESIQQLSVEKVVDFIKLEILPISEKRRKLSVQVDSRCSKEEIESKFKTIQLYIFLSSMGLPIKKEHLDEILIESGDSQIALAKLLYKYFRGKGKSMTLIVAVMAKLSKSLLFSNSETLAGEEAIAEKVEISERHLREWQTAVGFVRDKVPLEQKLQTFF